MSVLLLTCILIHRKNWLHGQISRGVRAHSFIHQFLQRPKLRAAFDVTVYHWFRRFARIEFILKLLCLCSGRFLSFARLKNADVHITWKSYVEQSTIHLAFWAWHCKIWSNFVIFAPADAVDADKCFFWTNRAFTHETQILAYHAEIRYLSTVFPVAMVTDAEWVAYEGRCADRIVLND